MNIRIHVFGRTPQINVPDAKAGDVVTVVLEAGCRCGELPGVINIPVRDGVVVVHGTELLILTPPWVTQ